ncbi:GNAT family N-acetyltransferase [Sinimarinibacterium sp. NLF-5-8]|uniref:bifunctional acetate--CoA ligase family protein/GNAT family N-acetyltransferase n=1 Tax=Sinimarinibacterium sp. NLF-5-8 TaxID=2698684 RepID=UPI00137BE5ED|nr:GNAT family N-acetyltransferase [Sinimarinibacterium sp. NLF-5-8]QHS10502.1 bifunctional acetate--CoA ligase family protein/GNAT family N-acetyltransferase [Sinimarinibacterium sp. NLF-5-8]
MSLRNLDALFRPQRVLVIGAAQDAPARDLIAQLETLPSAQRTLLFAQRAGWTCARRAAEVPPSELVLVLEPARVTPALIRQLAQNGSRSLIWFAESDVPLAVLRAGQRHTLRVLGPRTSGVAHAQFLTASAWPLPARGRTALIAQSRSIASAAIDWAAHHQLGFSWMAVSGGEADIDVADLLDYAALDTHTRAVVLQLSTIRSARKFMSAARACARAKPVIVLQTPNPASADGAPQDPVLSSAFARAGLVEVNRVTALFSALAALDRVGEAASGRIAVFATGAGLCQLAYAALLREGLTPTPPSDAVHAHIATHIAGAHRYAEAVDLEQASDDATLAALKIALDSREADCALLVRGPAPGRDDTVLAQKLVDAGLRERLVVVFLGQHSGARALQHCAQAQIAAFSSVESAARALRYRREHRRTQDLLMQTPTLDPLTHGAEGRPQLPPAKRGMPPRILPSEEAQALLAGYGLKPAAWVGSEGRGLRVRLRRHPQLGMYVSARLDPASISAPTAYALPPLDDVMAELHLQDAGLGTRADAPPGLRIRDYSVAVTRLAQLAAEQPRLREADIRLVPGDMLADVGFARVTLDATPTPARAHLALAPYPLALEHFAELRDGTPYRIRAIHPTDETALITMLSQARPEDIHLRFFRHIREFTHTMAARMTQIDYDREMSLVAVPLEGEQDVLGTVSVMFDPDGSEAEFAILIRPEYAGKRLGLQLMQDILAYAAARGAQTVFGEVLFENSGMLGLARRLGFTRHIDPDDPGLMRVTITPQTPAPLPEWLRGI